MSWATLGDGGEGHDRIAVAAFANPLVVAVVQDHPDGTVTVRIFDMRSPVVVRPGGNTG